jgi:hypothetical protein
MVCNVLCHWPYQGGCVVCARSVGGLPLSLLPLPGCDCFVALALIAERMSDS